MQIITYLLIYGTTCIVVSVKKYLRSVTICSYMYLREYGVNPSSKRRLRLIANCIFGDQETKLFNLLHVYAIFFFTRFHLVEI